MKVKKVHHVGPQPKARVKIVCTTSIWCGILCNRIKTHTLWISQDRAAAASRYKTGIKGTARERSIGLLEHLHVSM